MKNKIIFLILNLFLFFIFTLQLNASEQAWDLAQEGNKIILIRHSLAPGGGDPVGFKIGDCKTQRNLNKKGIKQKKKIGKLFNKNEAKQLKQLYNYVKKWNGNGKNLVLITHYSIITAVTNAVPSSGEIVVADKNFKVLGTIKTD